MKFLPSAADTSVYGWLVLLIMLLAAVVPAIGVFIWARYFKKKHRHKKSRRRRRDYSTTNPEVARFSEATPAPGRQPAPGEPKS
jgi:membrane protein DedA with SNARE-associated domain